MKEAKTVAELTQLKDKLALDRVSLIEDAEHSMPASLFSTGHTLNWCLDFWSRFNTTYQIFFNGFSAKLE